MTVKSVSPLDSLREWFVLHQRVRPFPLLCSEELRSIVVILHVGWLTSESYPLATYASLDRISLDVARSRDYFLLLISEVLLNVVFILHV